MTSSGSDGTWNEKTVTSKKKSEWLVLRVLPATQVPVILTDMVQTVLETSEWFRSKSTNTMHILSSGDE